MVTLSNFSNRRTVKIPAWAKAIQLVGNGIDGYPPAMPEELSVAEFVQRAHELQLKSGSGEWDVLVYATDHPKRRPCTVHPYGANNPYRRLRSRRGCHVKLLARFDYMRWEFFDFLPEA